jgi:hypothetical protein
MLRFRDHVECNPPALFQAGGLPRDRCISATTGSQYYPVLPNHFFNLLAERGGIFFCLFSGEVFTTESCHRDTQNATRNGALSSSTGLLFSFA